MAASILQMIALWAAVALCSAGDTTANHTDENRNEQVSNATMQAEEAKRNVDKAHAQLKDAVSLLAESQGDAKELRKNQTKIAALADTALASSHEELAEKVKPLQHDFDAQVAHLHEMLHRQASEDRQSTEEEIRRAERQASSDSRKLKDLSRMAHRDAYTKLKNSEKMRRGHARKIMQTAKNAARNMMSLRNLLTKAQRRARMSESVYEKDSLHYELAAEQLQEQAQEHMGRIEDSLGSVFDTAKDRLENRVEAERSTDQSREQDLRRAVSAARDYARHQGSAHVSHNANHEARRESNQHHEESADQHQAKAEDKDNQKMSHIQQELDDLKKGLHDPLASTNSLVELAEVPVQNTYLAFGAAGAASAVMTAFLVHLYTRPRMITPPLLG